MPGRDGKGPQGTGAGGRRGPCFNGTGRGPGFGARSQAEDSAQALKDRATVLERELEEVRSRIKDCTETG